MNTVLKGIRLPHGLISNIDSYAASEGISFSDAVRKLLTLSLVQNKNSVTNNDDFNIKKLHINIKSFYMLEALINRVFGVEAQQVNDEISVRTKNHIANNYLTKSQI